MDYADAVATKHCETVQAGSKQPRGTVQILVVTGARNFILVARLRAGFDSYVSPGGAKRLR